LQIEISDAIHACRASDRPCGPCRPKPLLPQPERPVRCVTESKREIQMFPEEWIKGMRGADRLELRCRRLLQLEKGASRRDKCGTGGGDDCVAPGTYRITSGFHAPRTLFTTKSKSNSILLRFVAHLYSRQFQVNRPSSRIMRGSGSKFGSGFQKVVE
jgi:hypothetical protein